ncbi:MAG: DUF1156 domain-containing protein, partial [Chloroflexi bacterium]|nr:DUF1156 domain-containing protein [Chloroflexota bacterium]
HGHISTLHIWWARRPLAACRAFIYASLVDDPATDREREDLLKEVADLASWDAIRRPDRVVRPREQGGSGLTGAELLARARRRILADNGGKPPRLLDPFAGGGAIPLEALRLGCEVEASDLNPVAVLILKCTLEYPQTYGRPLAEQVEQLRHGERIQPPGSAGAPSGSAGVSPAGTPVPPRQAIAGVNGAVPSYIRAMGRQRQSSFGEGGAVAAYERNPLAADVRYWGNWMLERARAELAPYYPPDPDGSIPVAYLWSRTVPCPNCGAQMPLIRQYWLARKENKKVALKPVVDRENRRVDFDVVEGEDVTGDPAEATTSRGDTVCLLCRQVVQAEYVRECGNHGGIGAALTAAALEASGSGGKRYRPDTQRDSVVCLNAVQRLVEIQTLHSDLPIVPDEPMPRHLTGGVITASGYDTFGKLFTPRQLVTLTSFVSLVVAAYDEMLNAGVDKGYAKAVATYLGLAVDRLADRSSTLCRWDPSSKMEAITNTFARQALPMVWDYAEGVPFSDASGGFTSCLSWILLYLELENFSVCAKATISLRDARSVAHKQQVFVTDPPYYDAINYADLSDFFYVWLKRSLGFLYPAELGLPLTPKKPQIVMSPYAQYETGQAGRRAAARQQYVDGMAHAFDAMGRSLEPHGLVGVVFAHTDPDAWATLIEGLLRAELIPDASWPLDTELENKVAGLGQARLKTSVWMACRPREEDAGEAFIGDVMAEMRPVVEERLLYFWSKGVRGADFFISAIGPALSVFGRHRRVLRPDGSVVTVRDFLDLVRKESTRVALEQVLRGADLGVVDPATRQYVTWVWSYSRAPLEAGEAIALCLATGADYREVVRPGSIAAEVREGSKKLVKLRTVRERGRQDETFGEDSPARPTPLIDQLQWAALLWSQNRPDDLAAFRTALGETRWTALRTLGQAVAECLPDGDEDRRLINGLLGSNVMGIAAPRNGPPRQTRPPQVKPARAGAPLPGFEEEMSNG